jgi:hypothetical protein
VLANVEEMKTVRRWDARRSLLAIFATAILTAILISCLPENAYVRYQQLDNTEYRNLRWIYERTHFDARPIDIAVLGSSRIATGVDARQLEASLRAAGLPLDVENFGIPFNGRNLDLEIARGLLANKQPQLLIIGVPERPSQHTHVTFKYVASSRHVLESLGYGNIDYLSDLIYLPYRHLRTLWLGAFPMPVDPADREDGAIHAYGDSVLKLEAGGHWQVSYPQRGLGELESGAKRSLMQRSDNPLSKVAWVANLSEERRNVVAITALARAHNTRVVFLFLPQFESDRTISERAFYESQGALLDAGFVSTRPDLYSSWGHLNARGARTVNAWLLRELLGAGLVKRAGSVDRAPPTPAGGGRPAAR